VLQVLQSTKYLFAEAHRRTIDKLSMVLSLGKISTELPTAHHTLEQLQQGLQIATSKTYLQAQLQIVQV
jgi:hypothetical protein